MSALIAFRHLARRLLRRVRMLVERYPQGGPLTLAVLVGFLSGLGAVVFAAAIDLADYVFFDLLYDRALGGLGDWRLVLIPAAGALLVAPTVMRYAPEARGPGVAEVLMSVETAAGRIRARVAAAKTVASAVTIGSGGSAGQEGPIVQIGAAVGSAFAQALRLSEENVKLLLAAGSAGGIAAIFNAPIAGVFFALEVILRRFNIRNFSVVVLSAVVATTTAVAIRGDEPSIPVPPYELVSAVEIPLYAGLGVAAGLASVAFITTLYWTEDRFQDLRRVPRLLLPVLGGFIVGALGLIDRGALGLGNDEIAAALTGEFAATTMIVLLVLKLLTTSATIGSGGSGGVFGPTLFLGAMLGGAYGSAVHGLLPDQTATAGAYATVGMGALVAGTARSPITAVLILFELTRDYGIILPVMTAVVVATLVSQLLSRHTIYTYKLARRGVLIEEETLPVNLMQSLRVSDAMSPSLVTVSPDAPQEEVVRALADDNEGLVMVVDEDGRLFGVISDTDLNETLTGAGADEGQTAADLCTRDVRTVYPDQSLHEALTILAGRAIHSLPVVLRGGERVPCGVLRRGDITNAYAAAIENREAMRRRGRLAPVTSDDVRYLELRVARDSVLNHHLLNEVRITEDAVIVAIRRDGRTLIPRGHTRLEEGDRVTVIAVHDAVDDLRAIFSGAAVPATPPTRPARAPGTTGDAGGA